MSVCMYVCMFVFHYGVGGGGGPVVYEQREKKGRRGEGAAQVNVCPGGEPMVN
jgi:hypothetical protein